MSSYTLNELIASQTAPQADTIIEVYCEEQFGGSIMIHDRGCPQHQEGAITWELHGTKSEIENELNAEELDFCSTCCRQNEKALETVVDALWTKLPENPRKSQDEKDYAYFWNGAWLLLELELMGNNWADWLYWLREQTAEELREETRKTLDWDDTEPKTAVFDVMCNQHVAVIVACGDHVVNDRQRQAFINGIIPKSLADKHVVQKGKMTRVDLGDREFNLKLVTDLYEAAKEELLKQAGRGGKKIMDGDTRKALLKQSIDTAELCCS